MPFWKKSQSVNGGTLGNLGKQLQVNLVYDEDDNDYHQHFSNVFDEGVDGRVGKILFHLVSLLLILVILFICTRRKDRMEGASPSNAVIKFGSSRPAQTLGERLIGNMFWILIIGQYFLGGWLIWHQNVIPRAGRAGCPRGWSAAPEEPMYCYRNDLLREMQGCHRNLVAESSHSLFASFTGPSFFDVLYADWIPATIIMHVAVLVAFVWFQAMRYFAYTMIIGSIGLACVILGYFGFRLGLHEVYKMHPSFVITVAVLVIYVVLMHAKIVRASKLIQASCESIRASRSMQGVNLVVFVLYMLYSLSWVSFLLQTPYVATIHPRSCYRAPTWWAEKIQDILVMAFTFTLVYFSSMNVMVSALGTGCWYFPDMPQPQYPAWEGLRWSLTSSSGACATASTIAYLVEEINAALMKKFSWLNPLTFILKIIWFFMKDFVIAVSRYSLIQHAFSGKDFWQSGRDVSKVLKNSVGLSFITDSITKKILAFNVQVFSVVIGMVTWTIYSDEPWTSEFHAMFYSCLMLWCIGHPIFCIVFLVLFDFWIVDDLRPFGIGCFMGSFCSLMYSFFAQMICNSTDVIMLCYALESQTDERQPRFGELYEVVGDEFVENPDGVIA